MLTAITIIPDGLRTYPTYGAAQVLQHTAKIRRSKIRKQTYPTIDMLRAFDGLAQHGTLSKAAEPLEITRQTLRRHIDDLEALYQAKLFELDQGRHSLTDAGKEALPDAQDILMRCEAWTPDNRYKVRRIDGLEHTSYNGPTGQLFYSQQHSIGSLHKTGLPVIKQMFAAWGTSMANLGHPAFQKFLPYLIVYRRTGSSWTFAEVGEQSAYAHWFGHENARSVMGTTYDDDLVDDNINHIIARAYTDVINGNCIRFDHLYGQVWRHDRSETQPISYQRLLANCIFPNGREALAMLAIITPDIVIDALEAISLPRMNPELAMDQTNISPVN